MELMPPFLDDSAIVGLRLYSSFKIKNDYPHTLKEHENIVRCCAWNMNTGHQVSGGPKHTIRVIQTIATEGVANTRDVYGNILSPSNIKSSQELTSHSPSVIMLLCWNEPLQKLTTADNIGQITVWNYNGEKGMWYEEMVNNRGQSHVVGMAWSPDGQRIIIAYQDGAVIVGSQDGSRQWTKDLPHELGRGCCWSPDSSLLLVALNDGEVHAYDSSGNFLSKLHMTALESVEIETALSSEFLHGRDGDPRQQDLRKDAIVCLLWYAPAARARADIGPPRMDGGYSEVPSRKRGVGGSLYLDEPSALTMMGMGHMESRVDSRPRILVVYAHGLVQLLRNTDDANGIVVRIPNLTLTSGCWSPTGAYFAVTGEQTDIPVPEKCSCTLFSAYGQKLRIFKIVGNSLKDCMWDPTGLRIGLALDNGIFYANVRPEYRWGWCGHTVVYAYQRERSEEFRVCFWETRLQEKYIKPVRGLESIACHGDYCCIVGKNEDASGAYVAQLCNGIGTPVDFKHIDVEPRFVALNATTAVIAGSDSFFIWHFQLPKRFDLNYATRPKAPELDGIYYLETLLPQEAAGSLSNSSSAAFNKRRKGGDPICAICIGDNFFLAATEREGTLYKFSLNNGSMIARFTVCSNADKMSLNCTMKRLAILTSNSQLKFYDLSENKAEPQPHEDKKEVWSYMWDEESEDTIAVAEKTKLIVYRKNVGEEGVFSAGYICQFKGLVVKVVIVDNFIHFKESPENKFTAEIEIKSLREARQHLNQATLGEAMKYIESNPHPRLWAMLSEAALNKVDLATAEHAFVKLKDYDGIQFCKKLQDIQDPEMRRAEVLVWLGKTDEAVTIYKKADRRDLAIDTRVKMNQWFALLQMLQSENVGDDALFTETLNQVGDHYVERLQWEQALRYYQQAGNDKQVFHCAQMMDDYEVIEKLAKKLPDANELLLDIGECFCNAGLAEQAVDCYLRCEKLNEALDVCIQLNQWEKAVQLSRQHNLRDVDSLLGKYAAELTGSNERTLAAVQLYKRAGKFLDAARIVYEIADEERAKASPVTRVKKLYVLGALLIEEHHSQSRTRAAEREKEGGDSAALCGLLVEDAEVKMEDSRMIDRAWRGAEAYHFFMLAHQQLYRGEAAAAMKTSLYLTDFDDLLDPVEVYSLLALSSAATRQFEVCSRAFMKLENLPDLNTEEREAYAKLAMKIFMKYPPTDTRNVTVDCPTCEHPIADYSFVCGNCDNKLPVCVVSGQPLIDFQFWLCPTCKHRAYETHIGPHKWCPLCHAEIL